MPSFIKARGSRRPRPVRPSGPMSTGPARTGESNKPARYRHKEECNPNGPSQLERGDVLEIDLRTVIGLRAAIDDAVYNVAERFGLTYHVLRGQFGVDGAVFKIGLEVKPRRSSTFRTGTAPIIPSDGPGKPLGSARLPKTAK